MDRFIPVNTPLISEGNEKKYVNECLDTGWISSEGPFVNRFEKEFAASVDRQFAVAVSNGSTALDAAMIALDVNEGDEVLMPSFTIISCASAIIRAGGTPVYIDCDPLTFNMNPDLIEAQITNKTKAIMVVHIYGMPCDMSPIMEIANRHNLKIIEDAAEVHGQTYKDSKCGSFGDVSTFSFYPNKHITTGEGGMIVTDSETIYEKCKKLRNLYFEPPLRFVHKRLGYNFRMSNIQAALGVAQLERLEQHIEIKRKIGRLYDESLKDVKEIQLPVPSLDFADNIYWVYSIVLDKSLGFDAQKLIKDLSEFGIGTRPFFYPMHKQPVLLEKGFNRNSENCPVSEHVHKYGLYLPSGLGLKESEIERVSSVLRKIIIGE